MTKAVYSIIVPLYNEEEVLLETYRRIKTVMDNLNAPYEIVLINDGSKDRTVEMVIELCLNDPTIKFIDFARNFGHQIAITAGMDFSEGDAIIVIDADLQDPPEVIVDMINKWKEGYEVVYGKRIQRKGETMFKRITAKIFYRVLSSMTDVDIPVDTGDFRLIDRKVCESLKLVNERSRYIRGIISWLGFKQTAVEFVREKRFAGETKYPLKKMIKFAFDAIASFSYKPLKIASYVGILVSFTSFLFILAVIYLKLFTTKTITGWASTLAINLFFNGITLMILGIIGEYIGRIYDEAKGRPLYIVRKTQNFSPSKADKLSRF